MALKICEYCGKAWFDEGGEKQVSLCPPCAQEVQGIYMLAWGYLRDNTAEAGRHRKVSIQQLADELGIDTKAINLLVKMGKIQIESFAGEGNADEIARNLEILRKLRKNVRGSSKYDRSGR